MFDVMILLVVLVVIFALWAAVPIAGIIIGTGVGIFVLYAIIKSEPNNED